MMHADMPPVMQERIVCGVSAAIKYEIPANLLLAVAETEGGKPGQWVKNSNGTYDVGSMQFNTSYLQELEKHGILPQDVEQAGCYSYDLAAWRLRGHLKRDKGDVWTRAANYHSRTPHYNSIYRDKLIKRAAKWEVWLTTKFSTFNLSGTGDKKSQDTSNPQLYVATPNQDAKRSEIVPREMQYQYYNRAADKALAAVFAPQKLQ